MIFRQERDDRNHRSKVIRVLQDQTRNTATELKRGVIDLKRWKTFVNILINLKTH